MVPNPEYKGEWKAKMIKNPAYKGIWEAPDIDNPEFSADATLYHFPAIKYAGFELWQVKSGSIFDNIIVTDTLAEAEALANETWAKNKDAEKEALDKVRCTPGWLCGQSNTNKSWRMARGYTHKCPACRIA